MKKVDVSEAQGPLTELMNQIGGENGRHRFDEFKLWLKRVRVGVLLLVDRSLSAEMAVNATGYTWWHKNPVEFDDAPVTGPDVVEQEIFELDYEATPAELDAEYKSRHLSPDLTALCAYLVKNPGATDKRPIACQWGLHPDGTAAFVSFSGGAGHRVAGTNRGLGFWKCHFRFAGVRK